MTSDKKCHLVPPEEQRCVWMTAGVLAYQLCERMLECEGCPLDHALRHRVALPSTRRRGRPAVAPQVPAGPEGLRPALRYSRNHCWTRQRENGRVLVGIEPGLSLALLAPRAVVFPSTGQRLRTGQTCLWVVAEGGTFPLECPMDGVVHDTNRTLGERPHLIHDEPFDLGWLYEIEPNLPVGDNPDLLDPGQAARNYQSDQNRLMALLAAATRSNHPEVGLTMADGGQQLQNISDMLGPARYFSLVCQVFA